MKKNNDTKDYSEQLEFLNSEPYYASKKIVKQSSDFPVRRTGSYRQSVTEKHWHYTRINTKNCSLSIVLTATDQKPQKSLKR